MLFICRKFHVNISKGFELLSGHEIMTDGQTDRQTDGQTDGQGDYYRAPPTSSGGALIIPLLVTENISDTFSRFTYTNECLF